VNIAVASGKGGTGKTTVAVNMAAALAKQGERVRFADCDVEQPNAHLFLSPDIVSTQTVTVPVPRVDEEKCTGCGECGRVCRFSAILPLGTTVITFPEMCHGCGGCMLACVPGAITETTREVGALESGTAAPGIAFHQGLLRVGEAMSPPLIKAVKTALGNGPGPGIIDCPPGTSCPVVAAVEDADAVILVTEPTPFGLSDLSMAVETVSALGLPMGVVINRAGVGDRGVYSYLEEQNIPLLQEIPYSEQAARICAAGGLPVDAMPEAAEWFGSLYEKAAALASERVSA